MRDICYCGSTSLEFIANVKMADPKTERYESLVAMCAKSAGANSSTGTSGLSIDIKAYFQVPASRKQLKKDGSPASGYVAEGTPHLQRPDASNVLKSIEDGLNGVAWHDDCCLADVRMRKFWTHGEPRAEIVVESLDLTQPRSPSKEFERNTAGTKESLFP
jgi:Holliday junction resolvase RusA-like endonuclease